MAVRVWLLFVLLAAIGLSLAPAHAETPEEQLANASGHFEARRYDEAARRLSAFLAANPNHPKAGAAALALGLARNQLGQWAQAIPAFEKAIASKDKAVVPAAQYSLGEAAMNANLYTKAAAALTEAVKTPLKPEQAEAAWFWLGQANLEMERYPDAERAFNKVVMDFPKSGNAAGALYGAAYSALQQDRNEVALKQFRQVLSDYPRFENRSEVLVLVAQMDRQAKRLAEARRGLETALADDAAMATRPELRATAEEELTGVLLDLKDYPAATNRLKASLARRPATDPQRPRIQMALGQTYFVQKQYEPALAAYREAGQAKDEKIAAESLFWGGNAALALGRKSDAAALFAQVTGRFPKSPQAAKAMDALVDLTDDPVQLAALLGKSSAEPRSRGTLRLARLYLERKNYDAAVAPLTDLAKTKPAPEIAAETQYLLGLAHEGQQKPAPAAAALAEAVRLAPSATWAVDARSRLAWLYLDANQPADSETAARAVLAAPGAAATVQQQARLALMQALLDQKKWDAASQEAQALLSGNPTPEVSAAALYTQAWAQESLNKPAAALPLWERLATQYPKHAYAADALLHIGDARFNEKQFEEARTRYAALLSGFAQSPLAPEARFKLGTALYNLDRYAEAAQEWDRVAADKSSGEYLPEALYWSGVALEKATRNADAVQRLTRLVNEYPTHTRVANAKVRLARLKGLTGS